MPYPKDADAELLLPKCPEDVTDKLLVKQYTAYRNSLLKMIREMREMVWPLGEQNARFVLNGLAVSLKAFLKAKQAGPGKKLPVATPPKAKEDKPLLTPAGSVSATESKPPASADGASSDGK